MITRVKSRTYLIASLCMLTTVFAFSISCIVYLTVSIYFPLEITPMNSAQYYNETGLCSIISQDVLSNCSHNQNITWRSCSSKENNSCVQVRAKVRRNGTAVRLEGCNLSEFDTRNCSEETHHSTKHKYACIMGECASLNGIYNCSEGGTSSTEEITGSTCISMTSVLFCNITETDVPIFCNSKKACLKLNGLYLCEHGQCAKIRDPYQCTKQCNGIPILGKNVIIKQGGTIHTANCLRAVDENTNSEIWFMARLLMMSCSEMNLISNESTAYRFSDCVNGTLLNPLDFGNTTSSTEIQESYERSPLWLKALPMRLIPSETNLLVYQNVKLYSSCNHYYGDSDECKVVLPEIQAYQETTVWSRNSFPCFYSNINADSAVIRKCKETEKIKSFLMLVSVPVVLLVGSGGTLLYIWCRLFKDAGKDSFFSLKCCKPKQVAMEDPRSGVVETTGF